jgi:hypothetical protein
VLLDCLVYRRTVIRVYEAKKLRTVPDDIPERNQNGTHVANAKRWHYRARRGGNVTSRLMFDDKNDTLMIHEKQSALQ